MTGFFTTSAARHSNHGCSDAATWQDRGDGTAICLHAVNCTSCWQVGHDNDHVYATAGEVCQIENLVDSIDL